MLDRMLPPPELSHSPAFKQPFWVVNSATNSIGQQQ